MNAHDDHDDRRLGADPHVGTVAEDDRHECHADGPLLMNCVRMVDSSPMQTAKNIGEPVPNIGFRISMRKGVMPLAGSAMAPERG